MPEIILSGFHWSASVIKSRCKGMAKIVGANLKQYIVFSISLSLFNFLFHVDTAPGLLYIFAIQNTLHS